LVCYLETPKVKIYEKLMCSVYINVDVNLGAVPCQASLFLRLCEGVLGIFGHSREGVARMEKNTQ
jgi:hypothetical protein